MKLETVIRHLQDQDTALEWAYGQLALNRKRLKKNEKEIARLKKKLARSK